MNNPNQYQYPNNYPSSYTDHIPQQYPPLLDNEYNYNNPAGINKLILK